MQIAEGNLPPIASPFGRFGPLATQMSTGHLRFTLVHFRVLIASDLISCIKKCRPERNGIFVNAPEAIRTPDARKSRAKVFKTLKSRYQLKFSYLVTVDIFRNF